MAIFTVTFSPIKKDKKPGIGVYCSDGWRAWAPTEERAAKLFSEHATKIHQKDKIQFR